jgi:hypothetical protein
MHLVLLGDSVFDNKAYVAPGHAVIDHVRARLDGQGTASLLAVDGDVSRDLSGQLGCLSALS